MQLGDRPLTLEPSSHRPPSPENGNSSPGGRDLTAPLSDELLLRVLSAVPEHFRLPSSLVCKRWHRLVGRLRRSLTLLRWSFLLHRLPLRFPDITDLDLVPASFAFSHGASSNILLTRGSVSVALDPNADPPIGDCPFLDPDVADRGLEALACGCPSLRRLSLVAAAVSDSALMAVAAGCGTLFELDLHACSDHAVRPISAFCNLQILRLVGSVNGLYYVPGITDIGLTIVAHGCKRLVKLELAGCEGSYDGISAIGRCCLMLEELTITDHRMDAGWMAGLSFCGNLKTLRLQSCKRIDADPGPPEHLGLCPAIERIQLQRCQIRDKRSLGALFMVCEVVRDVIFENCWGLDDEMFSVLSVCRRVKFLSLEGCSLLRTEGLESVIFSWQDLQSLIVVSCNNIKDDEVSPSLSNLFTALKELKWRPDSKSVLAMSLEGTGMGRKGGRFFKRRILRGQHRHKEKLDEDT